MTDEVDARFEALLDYLKRTRGFDFSGYKRSSLVRRVKRRMESVGIVDYVDYMDYLEVHPKEFTSLFNTILINVTGFFRDEAAWEYLANVTIPSIIGAKRAEEPIRVWSAGCASGEEAYSLAILLSEELGPEQFQERVKIYATDVDEEALAQARAASYLTKDMRGLTQALKDKYFTTVGERSAFRQDLRRSVIFGRHDLVQDAPISRLDLLVCRNTLMYLNAETQTKILSRFHFALAEHGILFLGKAEMLLTHANLFTPTEMKFRVFTKALKTSLRDRLLVMSHIGDSETSDNISEQILLKDVAFDLTLSPQIVIDSSGLLALANEKARSAFGLNQKDIGRPLQDLEISYRPVELRSVIEQCYSGRHAMRLSGVERRYADGHVDFLDVHITPLIHNGAGTIIGVGITFVDMTSSHKLHAELQRANQDLETANEELQSAHEELETTNEELQSTNEELETTNEELQSTNEELETMNEELQSTNEELETINAEQRQLTIELNSANSFLSSILASMRSAVVVLDHKFHIKVWNTRAEDLWGLRADEVYDESIFELDIGLPVSQLKKPLFNFDRDKSKLDELDLDATNRRGKAIKCHITITPLIGHTREVEGLVILMEEQ